VKIGFDVAQTCEQRAGCAWYADSLVRAMAAAAPEHHFFLYHQFGTLINPSTETGTHFSAPNVTETFTDVTSAEAARIWQSPSELIVKTGAPDIVHANSFRAPRVPGAKLVFTVYDVSFWAVPQYTTEENRLMCQHGVMEALANADGFVFISQSARDEFERYLPGWLEENRKPWTVTLLGPKNIVNVPEQGEQATPTTRRYWLSVGSLEPRKNYDVLLDAMELYWRKSERRRPLRIAGGSGWKSDALRSRIADFAARGIVEYMGYVPDRQILDLYRGAEAFIFPSWYEGFGLPLLEAMDAGCATLSSDRTSLKEVGGEAPIFFDPANVDELVNSMLMLETQPAVRNARAAAGRARAAEFSWQRTARLTLEFYSRVLA
jgi:glycosyltransferase involved in cell wall biosynthesis